MKVLKKKKQTWPKEKKEGKRTKLLAQVMCHLRSNADAVKTDATVAVVTAAGAVEVAAVAAAETRAADTSIAFVPVTTDSGAIDTAHLECRCLLDR